MNLGIKREYHDSGAGHIYQGKVWKTAVSEIKFSVRLMAGEDGKVVIKPGLPNGQAFEIGEVVPHSDTTGLVKFVDKIGFWSSDGLLNNMLTRMNTIKEQVDNAVDQNLADTFNDLGSMVVFPGPGVFFYSRMQFSEHGDLEMELAYKA